MNPTHMVAHDIFDARMVYEPNDPDDLLSIQRFLFLNLPSDIKLFRFGAWEGTFKRPAVTLRLVDTQPLSEGPVRRPSWTVEHQIVAMAYHLDRAQTLTLGQQVHGLLHAGGRGERPYSIPLWVDAWGAELARKLRVVRPSIRMGLEATDDENKWARPVEFRVRSPRLRPQPIAPVIDSITVTTGVA